jgi:hypothetical protein
MKREPMKRMDYTDWTVEQHAEYLKAHPAYQAYFANYSKTTVDYFISSYADVKHAMLADKARHKADYEEHRTIFMRLADDFIDIILQKKLFNLQCRWRAGEMDLPHVLSTHDFSFWEHNIRSCPIIPPITEDEIDICIRFLTENIDYETPDWDDCGWEWQDYETFKMMMGFFDEEEEENTANTEGYENDDDDDDEDDEPYIDEDGEYPAIYKFFDKHQNTRFLMASRDVRTPKQERYMDETRRLYREREEAAAKANGTWREPDPVLRQEEMDHFRQPGLLNAAEFVEAVEDGDTKEAYRYKMYWQNIFSEWHTEDFVEFLTQFNEPIAIEVHEDWRKAVELTARRFRQKKIVEMLPYAFAAYSLEFDEEQTPETLVAEKVARYVHDPGKDYFGILLHARGMLLDGRESLDGVRDLNVF